MKFHSTSLAEAYVIELEPKLDDRGFFARQFCDQQLKSIGFHDSIVQINQSYNHNAGTLRGLHFQLEPNAEVKMVQCVRGRLWDVIVDLRHDSPSYRQWVGTELSPDLHRILYVPKGFAHGYITLEPNTDIIYFVTSHYAPQSERGLLWSDATIGIEWPIEPASISAKDESNPTLDKLLEHGPLFQHSQ